MSFICDCCKFEINDDREKSLIYHNFKSLYYCEDCYDKYLIKCDELDKLGLGG